jgi:tRNA (cytidine/uridine-2'-O-)-methyltransferase
MKLLLYQPQIPQNTGTLVRTCAATGAELLLVPPLGFSLASRHLKRAGLDYWDAASVHCIEDLSSFLDTTPHPFFFFSSKASKLYTEIAFPADSILIFGSETEGLPPFLWEQYPELFYRIPMIEGQRCLNLAVSASVVLFEALRQNQFASPHVRFFDSP